MATPAQQSSVSALPMLVTKRTSSPSITNYPPLFHGISKHNVLIIGGHMNAQICKNVNNKFSLHNLSNKNWEHLTDFTLENRLTCLNIKFQKRNGKIWTYTYTNNAKAQINYIIVNKKWNNNALNC